MEKKAYIMCDYSLLFRLTDEKHGSKIIEKAGALIDTFHCRQKNNAVIHISCIQRLKRWRKVTEFLRKELKISQWLSMDYVGYKHRWDLPLMFDKDDKGDPEINQILIPRVWACTGDVCVTPLSEELIRALTESKLHHVEQFAVFTASKLISINYNHHDPFFTVVEIEDELTGAKMHTAYEHELFLYNDESDKKKENQEKVHLWLQTNQSRNNK